MSNFSMYSSCSLIEKSHTSNMEKIRHIHPPIRGQLSKLLVPGGGRAFQP